MAAQRKFLSLETKVALIKFKDRHPTYGSRALAEMFNCSKSQVNKIIATRTEILGEFETNGNISRTRNCVQTYGNVNKATYDWFVKARQKDIHITGATLQRKAIHFADVLGVPNFSASNGWLDSFKKRNGLAYRDASLDVGVCDLWQERLPLLCEGYEFQDVYNAKETGLFWRVLPKRSLALRGERCLGGKKSKERLSILLCVNATGSDRKKPLIVGKFENPHAFKNWDRNCITYKFNDKSWMTADLFQEWLKDWDKELKESGRKILLFVDNAPCHRSSQLEHIKLVFWPPKKTELSQPLDQGIIKGFKGYCRSRVIQKWCGFLDDVFIDADVSKVMNLRDACVWAAQSLLQISNEAILSCFKKSGFPVIGDVDDVEDPLVSLSDDGCIFGIPLNNYATCDDQVLACEEVEDGIVQPKSPDSDKTDGIETWVSDEEDDDAEVPTMSLAEIRIQLENIKLALWDGNMTEAGALVEQAADFLDQQALAFYTNRPTTIKDLSK